MPAAREFPPRPVRADVVLHLAFLIMGRREETQRTNLEGSRNVFEAAAAGGAKRLIYASSVAAYGFHAANPRCSPRRFRRARPTATTTTRPRKPSSSAS